MINIPGWNMFQPKYNPVFRNLPGSEFPVGKADRLSPLTTSRWPGIEGVPATRPRRGGAAEITAAPMRWGAHPSPARRGPSCPPAPASAEDEAPPLGATFPAAAATPLRWAHFHYGGTHEPGLTAYKLDHAPRNRHEVLLPHRQHAERHHLARHAARHAQPPQGPRSSLR